LVVQKEILLATKTLIPKSIRVDSKASAVDKWAVEDTEDKEDDLGDKGSGAIACSDFL